MGGSGLKLKRDILGYSIRAELQMPDHGWDVSVYGGSRSHVGAVSLAEPNGCVQTIERDHHRDSAVSALWSQTLATQFQTPVCVRCGIHYDNITKEQLSAIVHCCDELLQEIISHLKEG